MTKKLAKVLGIVVIVVGVLGFFSNPIVGTTGFFHTNVALDIVYIILGLILVLCGTDAKAKMWLKIVGIVYLLLAIFGIVMMKGAMTATVFGLEVGTATNWLHLVLGLVMLLKGMMGGKMMSSGAMGGSQM